MKTKIRYKYSPQLKIYDELMNNWEPYTMFKHPKNFRSKILNTDNKNDLLERSLEILLQIQNSKHNS